ncbi:hypothetical protein ACI77O_12300 [Pseudomonas tritici]|uniref:hypothetical protein n=1 Tax=Pseudomonas tritici TaxID=2745518 RepID=UPI00387B93B1
MGYNTFSADQGTQLLAARRKVSKATTRVLCQSEQIAAARPFVQIKEEMLQIVFLYNSVLLVRIGFAPLTDRLLYSNVVYVTQALKALPEQWNPVFSKWRGGGWNAHAVHYPTGSIGCVSCNYPDKKWRIVCDERRTGALGEPGDQTYPTRLAAAGAEYELAQGKTREMLARVEAVYDSIYSNNGMPGVSSEDVAAAIKSAGSTTTLEWLIREGHAVSPAAASALIEQALHY